MERKEKEKRDAWRDIFEYTHTIKVHYYHDLHITCTYYCVFYGIDSCFYCIVGHEGVKRKIVFLGWTECLDACVHECKEMECVCLYSFSWTIIQGFMELMASAVYQTMLVVQFELKKNT